MERTYRIGFLFPIFVAAFVGNAAWDFTEVLIRRGAVIKDVNLRYDAVTTRRLQQIQQVERQEELRQRAIDNVTLIQFEGIPPRPITWFDVDGKTPSDTQDYLRITSDLKKRVPVIDFPPLPKRK